MNTVSSNLSVLENRSLIERNEYLTQIENELEHSQFVALTGFPGAGKSVLVNQYSKALLDKNCDPNAISSTGMIFNYENIIL